jgi:hypothetical protein
MRNTALKQLSANLDGHRFVEKEARTANTGLKVILFCGGKVSFWTSLQEMKFIVYLT